jgi:hypothetical protein
MKQVLLLSIIIFFTKAITAQVSYSNNTSDGSSDPEIIKNTHIQQDPLLTEMLEWHVSNNKKDKQIEGFRVEIFFSSDADAKEKALKKKVEFLKLYPENTVHIKYVAPNFRVRVGDFRTKNEALKLFKEIKNTYPLSFIVTDNIDFPLMKPLQYE